MKFVALLMSVALLVSSFAGCASPENVAATPDKPGSQQAEPAEASPAKTSLAIGVGAEFSNIVPLSNNVAVANRDGVIIYALYDSLLWWDSEAGEIKPCLATSWEISDDGLEYTLHLRKDVTFHDGSKMTAEDVAWTLNLLPDNPAVASQQFPTFDRAEVVDEHTVKVFLVSPFVPMVNAFASYHIGILSKSYYDKVGGWEGYIAHPIGTGPYQFVSRTMGSSIVMKAYDGCWSGAPQIKDVKVNIIPDANSQLISLENGEIDVLMSPSIQNMMHLDKSSGVQWDHCISDSTAMFFFNQNMEITMNDENLRKAILSGINYDGINNTINGGYTQKANCVVRPGLTGRPEDGTFTPAISYDLEAAKDYLAQSNYVSGTPLNLICIAGSLDENIAKVVQGDMQSLGINVQVSPLDGATFFTRYLQSDGFDLVMVSFTPSLYDVRSLSQSYDAKMPSFAGSLNPDKEKLAELGRLGDAEMDPAKRVEIYREMIDLINVHAYIGYLYYGASTMAWQEGLQGIKVISATNYRISDWHWA